MTKEEKKKRLEEVLLATKYGCTIEELKNNFRVGLSVYEYGYIGNLNAYIMQEDAFHRAYARVSNIILEKEGDISKEDIKFLTSRITAKIRQQTILEEIKQKAYEEIPEFISKSFGINKELITQDEIDFSYIYHFEVAGQLFRYGGTIIDKSFIIKDREYMSYSNFRKVFEAIHYHFSDRQEGLLTEKKEAHDIEH